jgi:hypothetical protein
VDWITSETRPLLKAYCRHAMYADRFAADIMAARLRLDALEEQGDRPAARAASVVTKLLHELHRVHAAESDRMVKLATKMRFTNQSRYVPEKAASKARASLATGPKPWHDWGDQPAEN